MRPETRAHAFRRRTRSVAASRDRWLVSYADFMTLLFAFFTTLYAVSTVDAGKLSSVAAGLHQAFDRSGSGVLPSGRGVVGAGDAIVGSETAARPARTVVEDETRAIIERALSDDLAAHRIQLTEDRRGLVLSIPEAGAFPPGRAEMSASAELVMTRLASALRELPNAARVEGHTDDTPIHNAQFSSNWELSTARATNVVQFLTKNGAIAPDRLSAAGYGPFRPVADNTSADGRSRNRRVDVVVLNDATRSAEEPTLEAAVR